MKIPYDYEKCEPALLRILIILSIFCVCVGILIAHTDTDTFRKKEIAQYKLDNEAIDRNLKIDREILNGK